MKTDTLRLGQALGCRDDFRRSSFIVGIMLALLVSLLLIFGHSSARAQTPGVQAVGTMSDIMVSMVYPAANNILLSIYRGGPQTDQDWTAVKRQAVLLAQSGNVLLMSGPAGGQGEWAQDAKILVEVGAAVYKAAGAKDANAFLAVAQPLNAACTTCHKQYRANIATPSERVGPDRQPAE
jgi:cytochrome c556